LRTPDRGLKSNLTLRAKVKEGPGESDRSPRSGEGCVIYEGSLDAKELLDWIRALDTYFDYEEIEEDKKVRHDVMLLKGHATLWWDELQVDRRSKGK
jgi:hypothetical protein